jgi:hypothetical protein
MKDKELTAMDNPDGRGTLTISRMTIESDSVSFDFEGKVEGYGTVFRLPHPLVYRRRSISGSSSG